MTTTPNPTAIELSDADDVAALNYPYAASEHDICNLARCYLALKAQLAESERAREAVDRQHTALLDALSDTGTVPHPLRERIRAAIAADPRRGDATTTSTPECRERALADARSFVSSYSVPFHGDEADRRMARVLLRLHDAALELYSELPASRVWTEGETAIARALGWPDPEAIAALNSKLDALAADQTATARESAENTAEETMTEAEVSRDCGNKNHDEGVIRNGKCSACGSQLLKLIGPEEPAPAQTPEPTLLDGLREAAAQATPEQRAKVAANPSGFLAQTPEPVEPSDDALFKIETAAVREVLRSGDHSHRAQNKAVRRALYRAGLAAEAAAHEDEVRKLIDEAKEAYSQVAALKVAQAEETQRADVASNRVLGIVEDLASKLRAEWSADSAELERVRGQLLAAEDNATRYYREAGERRAQARARRVPTREDLGAELEAGYVSWHDNIAQQPGNQWQAMADAVLRLFAEAPPVDEPTHGVASPPKRFASADEALSCLRETLAEECHQEHPAHDAIEVLQRAAEPTSRENVIAWARTVAAGRREDHEYFDVARVLAELSRPVPVVLHCPKCKAQHLDEGEWATREHRKHQCQSCRHEWRASSVATVGVLGEEQRAAEPTPEAAWNYSAPPDSEIGKMHELKLDDEDRKLDFPIAYAGMTPPVGRALKELLPTWGGWRMGGYGSVKAWRPASAAPAKANESDSAWLKRTVEELTTARSVEVTWDDGMHRLEAPGVEPLLILHAVQQRRTDWIVDILTSNNWPLRTKAEVARAAEPSPQPGGFLDALTDRVTELERRMTRRQKQAQETNDRLARLERDSHAPVDFTDIFAALTRRVEALEVAYGTVIAKQDELRCMYEADEQAKSDKV